MVTFEALSRAAIASAAASGRESFCDFSKVSADSFVASPVSVTRPTQVETHVSNANADADASNTAQANLQLLPRTQVLHLGAAVGSLCSSLLTYAPLDPPGRNPLAKGVDESKSFPASLAEDHTDHTTPNNFWSSQNTNQKDLAGKKEIAKSMAAVFLTLFLTANACGVNLQRCILRKLALNGRKYPVELCRGKSGKYTEYSDHTGITTDRKSQSTVGENDATADVSGESVNGVELQDKVEGELTISEVTQQIRTFATDRTWSRYHTPRNICLAMMGEVGELAELFQWKGDGEVGAPSQLGEWSEEDIDHVSQELADVTIYLMRLADVCGVDLAAGAMAMVGGSIDR